MIRKQDILDRAAEWRLRPDVVEKDYILGWLLAALAQHEEVSTHWVFKGGTCLKKCFFETYRFSEDLDFSLLPEARYTEQGLRTTLQEVVRSASDLSGNAFPPERVVVKTKRDKLGRATFQGNVTYRGPLATPYEPRVLFDLTRQEPVLAEPSKRNIFHPYPDKLPEAVTVKSYSIEELFAEKTRALFERTRPRDLYDVVFLLENQPEAIDLVRVRTLFHQKCRAKDFQPPTAAAVFTAIEGAGELRSEWENMLGHQLPQLPPLDGMLERVTALLSWIDTSVASPAMQLASASLGKSELLVAPPSATYWGAGVPLDLIRFAGANRLLVEMVYDGRRRTIEPYSLRRPGTGNLLLYAFERESRHIKAYAVAKIGDVEVTATSFSPRYRVEF